MVEIIYVAASAHDARYTRICIASIRYFYPDIPIQLLVGGPLESGLAEELERYWNVGLADLPRGDWGWGFIKLEPLFLKTKEVFLVLDSDTVITGLVLNLWNPRRSDFMVDIDEPRSKEESSRLYYDWQKIKYIDSNATTPKFFFNTGQWFGKSGILRREDFLSILNWNSMPPKIIVPDIGHPSDQAVLNYVLNQKNSSGVISVEQCSLMHWPGNGMQGLTAKKIVAGLVTPKVIHWAGIKEERLSSMKGGDVLIFFENYYYDNVPKGTYKKHLHRIRYPMTSCIKRNVSKIRNKFSKLLHLKSDFIHARKIEE